MRVPGSWKSAPLQPNGFVFHAFPPGEASCKCPPKQGRLCLPRAGRCESSWEMCPLALDHPVADSNPGLGWTDGKEFTVLWRLRCAPIARFFRVESAMFVMPEHSPPL